MEAVLGCAEHGQPTYLPALVELGVGGLNVTLAFEYGLAIDGLSYVVTVWDT